MLCAKFIAAILLFIFYFSCAHAILIPMEKQMKLKSKERIWNYIGKYMNIFKIDINEIYMRKYMNMKTLWSQFLFLNKKN